MRWRSPNAWKWWLTIVLFLATVLTYLDRQTMSLCGAMICQEMGLSNEQYGQLLRAFRWCYAVTHVPAGFMADHFSLRWIYAVAVAVWSLAGAAGAFTNNFRQLLLTRGLLGIGEASNWPCATRIVANMLPPQDRGLASGIFNSGAAVGSLIAPLVIVPIALAFGWRWAFFVIGSIGFLWIILWLSVTRPHAAAHGALSRAEEPRSPTSVPWARRVLLHPGFWLLLIVGVSVNPCWYFLNEWIPKYLHDQRGMGYMSAGLATTPMFVGADLGNILSGGLIKYLIARGWTLRRARGTTLALAAMMVLPVAFITQVQSGAACIAMLAAAAFGITSFLANYTACQQDFSFANVGIVAGILGMACNIFSAEANPRIGRYVDVTGNYTLPFVLIGVLPLVSLGAILLFDKLLAKHDS